MERLHTLKLVSHRRAATHRLHPFHWGKGGRGVGDYKSGCWPGSGCCPRDRAHILPYRSAFPVLKLSAAAAAAATFENAWPFTPASWTLRQRGGCLGGVQARCLCDGFYRQLIFQILMRHCITSSFWEFSNQCFIKIRKNQLPMKLITKTLKKPLYKEFVEHIFLWHKCLWLFCYSVVEK